MNWDVIRNEKGLTKQIKITSSTIHNHTWYKTKIGNIFYAKRPYFDNDEYIDAFNEKCKYLGTVHKDDFEWIT